MKYFVSFIILLQSSFYFSQNILPNKSKPAELSKEAISNYINNYNDKSSSIITTQPNGNLRTMAEWEEVQAICITWTGYKSILAKIVEEVQSECEVIIL
jgi:agmatine deiminase